MQRMGFVKRHENSVFIDVAKARVYVAPLSTLAKSDKRNGRGPR